MKQTILIVDDEQRLREVVALALEDLGYKAYLADSGVTAIELLAKTKIDLVLSDLRMPKMNGIELLTEIRRQAPGIPVVIMTAYSTLKDAVKAIKEGAFDFISKPFEIEELAVTIANALRLHDALRDNLRLRNELAGQYRFEDLVGISKAFRPVIEAILEVCESRANVLVVGESGTGKEMVARAIHFNSARRDGPFIPINCAAIPEGLLESELFGHVKGAFTGAISQRIGRFAQADGGTLFLDEIGDMPVAIQAKILRVLQERNFEPVGGTASRSVDVRIIAATNKDLREAVRNGTFRNDLYYRLNVFPIELPPLRDRYGDIPLLIAHCAKHLSVSSGALLPSFSPAAMSVMEEYAWPGNVRELQNVVERVMIIVKGRQVEIADLPQELKSHIPTRFGHPEVVPSNLEEELQRIEREFILKALELTDGVQVQAAGLLGISERSLWHRIKKLGISVVKRAIS